MTKNKLLLSFWFTFTFCSLWVSSSLAQTPELIVINHVAPEEQEESLALKVFFTLTDSSGRPLSQANIESATIQLLGPNNEPVEATIEDPQTPVFIVLLVDGSGSMQGVIEDVRQAAVSAIDGAPSTAHFAVIQFNEETTMVEDFTNDHNRVKAAINVVESVPNKGTCLYDALYEAIDLLDDQIQNPEERRAIILFTDGKDQLTIDSDDPCSRHTYNDVINAARPASLTAPITPIHTIGLFDEQGGNLNEAELRSLATDTVAFSAIGGQTNLGSLFQEIIDGLNSQFVARANVFAEQGENQAVLSIIPQRSDSTLTATFSFISNRDYDLPAPPVNVQISSLQYNEEEDVYFLSLSLASPESISRIVVNVWDVRRGVQVSPDQFFENPGETLLIELPTDNFEVEREYSIHVQAIDQEGFLIQDEEGETLLAESEIVYEPPQPPEPIEFSIQSVNADYENGFLTIDLDISEEGRVQTYEGFIVDDSTGAKIHDFGPAPFTSRRVQEVLPDAIRTAEIPGSYRVTVYLTTQEQLRSEANFDEFKPVPPEPPGLMSRISTALGNNPAILISIGVIILAIVFWIIFRNRQSKKSEVPVIRPPIDKTSIFVQSERGKVPVDDFDDWFQSEPAPVAVPQTPQVSSGQRRLSVKVMQVENQAPILDKIITQFPCYVGREGCDVNIPMDRRVSRRHIEINISGHEILVTDLGSRNGTFIGDTQLAPNTPTPLTNSEDVHLGSQSYLKLKLL